jgi:hypothetical protein
MCCFILLLQSIDLLVITNLVVIKEVKDAFRDDKFRAVQFINW